MQNSEIARQFEELADLLEIQGANPFRLRAYRNAARTISGLPESIADIANQAPKELQALPGIGKDLAEKIETIVESATLPQLEKLKEEIPADVVRMLDIPGIGPKKVAFLFSELSIHSLDDLKAAAEQGVIAEQKGFGKKTAQIILEGLEHLSQAGNRIRLADAKAQSDAIIHDLQNLDSVQQISEAGSCRRRKETVGDLDILITSSQPEEVMDALENHELVNTVLARGETKQRVRLNSGLEMDLRVVPEESYGAALMYFTGSKEHNIVLRRRSQEKGLKLNEYGLFREEKLVSGKTEEEVYETLDLPDSPEIRENRMEFKAAENNQLPELIELKHIRGDLHMHTTATDGTASILEMAEGAKAKGYQYIAITDHSKRVTMANGLDAKRLRAQWKDIEQVQSKLSGIQILKGIECDILEDGRMDLPDDVLAEADWVIAVLHYGLKQPQEQINQRLLNAIRNPHVSILGHLSGRLIGKRPGADLNYSEILKAAADHGTMLEINAHPMRLDIDDIHAAKAKELGIPIVINTDAHSTGGLEVMQFGVYQARRAGLSKKDVANTKTWNQFRKLLNNCQ